MDHGDPVTGHDQGGDAHAVGDPGPEHLLDPGSRDEVATLHDGAPGAGRAGKDGCVHWSPCFFEAGLCGRQGRLAALEAAQLRYSLAECLTCTFV